MGSTEDLFEGQPTGLPAPMSRGSALYLEGSGPAAKVRHVGGYAPFIGFCAGRGVRAEELASDIERLIWFLRAFETRTGSSKLVACSRAYAVPTTNRSAGLFPGCPSGHGKKWTIFLPSRPCRWPRSQDSLAMSGRPCRRRPTTPPRGNPSHTVGGVTRMVRRRIHTASTATPSGSPGSTPSPMHLSITCLPFTTSMSMRIRPMPRTFSGTPGM